MKVKKIGPAVRAAKKKFYNTEVFPLAKCIALSFGVPVSKMNKAALRYAKDQRTDSEKTIATLIEDTLRGGRKRLSEFERQAAEAVFQLIAGDVYCFLNGNPFAKPPVGHLKHKTPVK